MCGISGYAALNCQQLPHTIPSSIHDAHFHLRFRGPNAQNSCQLENVMFGHSRLAIIDLEGGKQPMLDTEAGFMLSYNGELYNYRELRLELIAKGHQFHSESDTEVLLKAWIEWG